MNRADTLHPALLWRWRLDPKIEFPLPGHRRNDHIFGTMNAKINLMDEVDLAEHVARPEKIHGELIRKHIKFFVFET